MKHKRLTKFTLQLKPLQSYEQVRIARGFRRLLRSMPAAESQQFARALYTLAEKVQFEALEDAKYSRLAMAVAGVSNA